MLAKQTALVLSIFALTSLSTGCAYWARVKPDLTSCAAGVVPAAVADLQAKVMQSLLGDPTSPSWENFAKDELSKYAIEFATCAVLAALHDINSNTQVTTAYMMVSHVSKAEANKRAYEWLKANGK